MVAEYPIEKSTKPPWNEYLVRIVIGIPPEMPPQQRDDLYEAEGKRVIELTDGGYCKRLWRVMGDRANWGLWEAPTPTALHAALSSLPLWKWQDVQVIPLALNINDPARGDWQTMPFTSDDPLLNPDGYVYR